jgi:hypothetical protein
MSLDILDLEDDDRRISTTRESSRVRPENSAPERPARLRCDHAHRELYRHHFPADC